MIIKIEGKLTAGYYNDMEAGHPVFVDGESLSTVVKDKLREMGMSDNFCYGPFGKPEDVEHPLIGRTITLTLEIADE